MIDNSIYTQTADKEKTIVKVSALWHFVADYLEMLRFTGAIIDEDFCRIYDQLLSYVYTKLETRGVNILNEYVVYEVEL